MAAGLLAIAFVGSILGAFGMAAIGAENDATANLAAAVLFVSTPVAISIVSTLAAFDVLASIYIPRSVGLFRSMTGALGAFGLLFSAASIADCYHLHPRTMSVSDFDAWLARQWIRSRSDAVRQARRVMTVGMLLLALAFIFRYFVGWSLPLSYPLVNTVVGLGALLSLVGAALSVTTATKHPMTGNEQHGLQPWEAWAPNLAITLFTCLLIFALP